MKKSNKLTLDRFLFYYNFITQEARMNFIMLYNEMVELRDKMAKDCQKHGEYPGQQSLNNQFRKVIKTKAIFPNDESLFKMVYLATEKASNKWTRSYSGWDLVINELNIIFEEVLSKSE